MVVGLTLVVTMSWLPLFGSTLYCLFLFPPVKDIIKSSIAKEQAGGPSIIKFDERPFEWMETPQIVVRDTYLEFLKTIKSETRNIIVGGNPGIGKSFFGVYLLRILILQCFLYSWRRGILYTVGESPKSTLPKFWFATF